MSEDDYKELELIDVKLPRKDYETLKRVIEREDAYDWLSSKVKSFWVWTVAGGILTFIAIYKDVLGMFK